MTDDDLIDQEALRAALAQIEQDAERGLVHAIDGRGMPVMANDGGPVPVEDYLRLRRLFPEP